MQNKVNKKLYTTLADGSVVINSSDSPEIWRPWGHPDGFGVSGCRTGTFGELSPILKNNLIAGSHSGALESIKKSIPKSVQIAVRNYTHYEIELIQLAERQPAAFLHLCWES